MSIARSSGTSASKAETPSRLTELWKACYTNSLIVPGRRDKQISAFPSQTSLQVYKRSLTNPPIVCQSFSIPSESKVLKRVKIDVCTRIVMLDNFMKGKVLSWQCNRVDPFAWRTYQRRSCWHCCCTIDIINIDRAVRM